MPIRQLLRQARKTIPTPLRLSWDQQVCHQLEQLSEISAAQHIAAYFAVDGEVDIQAFYTRLTQANKACYLPVLNDKDSDNPSLNFALFTPDTPMKSNRYGILEPDIHQSPLIELTQLDVVLLPLVGFTEQCHRLGMGGGYYDRTFAFRRERKAPPVLIGIGYECQKSKSFPVYPWDVRCDKVVTQKTSYSP